MKQTLLKSVSILAFSVFVIAATPTIVWAESGDGDGTGSGPSGGGDGTGAGDASGDGAGGNGPSGGDGGIGDAGSMGGETSSSDNGDGVAEGGNTAANGAASDAAAAVTSGNDGAPAEGGNVAASAAADAAADAATMSAIASESAAVDAAVTNASIAAIASESAAVDAAVTASETNASIAAMASDSMAVDAAVTASQAAAAAAADADAVANSGAIISDTVTTTTTGTAAVTATTGPVRSGTTTANTGTATTNGSVVGEQDVQTLTGVTDTTTTTTPTREQIIKDFMIANEGDPSAIATAMQTNNVSLREIKTVMGYSNDQLTAYINKSNNDYLKQELVKMTTPSDGGTGGTGTPAPNLVQPTHVAIASVEDIDNFLKLPYFTSAHPGYVADIRQQLLEDLNGRGASWHIAGYSVGIAGNGSGNNGANGDINNPAASRDAQRVAAEAEMLARNPHMLGAKNRVSADYGIPKTGTIKTQTISGKTYTIDSAGNVYNDAKEKIATYNPNNQRFTATAGNTISQSRLKRFSMLLSGKASAAPTTAATVAHSTIEVTIPASGYKKLPSGYIIDSFGYIKDPSGKRVAKLTDEGKLLDLRGIAISGDLEKTLVAALGAKLVDDTPRTTDPVTPSVDRSLISQDRVTNSSSSVKADNNANLAEDLAKVVTDKDTAVSKEDRETVLQRLHRPKTSSPAPDYSNETIRRAALSRQVDTSKCQSSKCKNAVEKAYIDDMITWQNHAVSICGGKFVKGGKGVLNANRLQDSAFHSCAGLAPRFSQYEKGGDKYPFANKVTSDK